jgi:hypothetical protein
MFWFVWLACRPECPSDLERVDPPVYGGGVEVLSDGFTAVAIDAETGRVMTIDTNLGHYLTETRFDAQSQPWRIAGGPDDLVYVTLRGSGELGIFERTTGEIVDLVPVCPAPRGVAAAPDGTIFVACAGGELVSISEEGEITSELVAPDLRDVVVDGQGEVWVSTFRSARVISMSDGASYTIPRRRVTDALGVERTFEAGVAWRMRPREGGGVDVLHRLATTAVVDRISDGTAPPGPSCSSDVLFALSTVTTRGVEDGPVLDSALAVDFVPRGNDWLVIELAEWTWEGQGDCEEDHVERHWGHGGATDALGRTIVLTRNPFTVTIGSIQAGPLVTRHLQDLQMCNPPGSTGSAPNLAFHSLPGHDAPPCAACHPEGGDDGNVWDVLDHGPLRTPDLRGGLRGSEPLHWNGEFATLDELLYTQVPHLAIEAETLLDWLDALPADAATPSAPDERVEQGRALAEEAGCLGCHAISGPSVSASFDVGTGGEFQVPRLAGVGLRLPLMHDGCAKTLADRFDPDCGGTDHGDTEDLSPDEIEALVAWLGSL